MPRLRFELTALLILTISTAALSESTFSYGFRGEDVELAWSEARAAVVLEDEFDSLEGLSSVLAEHAAFVSPSAEDRRAYRGLWILHFTAGLDRAEKLAALTEIHRRPGVTLAAPALRYGRTRVIPKPEILLVLKGDRTDSDLEALLEEPDLELRRGFASLQPTALLAWSGTPAEVFERCRELRRHESVESASPNLIQKLDPPNVTPNDPLFPDMWAHENVQQVGGTPGADIATPEAWDITTGSPGIVIAILDEGVDVDHEDLADLMVPGHDSTNQPPPEGIPGNAAQNDPHGTNCAGLAAAVGNNEIGVVGVSWNARIMPVRLGYGSHWTETAWTIDAFVWAADNGADILSNSWGGGPPETAQENAVIYAATTGRNGTGSVVVGASGNWNSSGVIYPAAYPSMIAVGASSPCDERKSPASCDGETYWGSNWGAELDLVAPGVLCPTTDIMGPSGADPGNYEPTFNGTSCATPHVAGAAALLLGLRQELSPEEVRELLHASADDQVGLPGEDTPGFDVYMGWGRLNVRQLLELAGTPFIRGDTDGSGVLEITDPIQILNELFLNGTLGCEDAADANDDGVLDVADAVYILNTLFADGPVPPAPYPDPGIDPTPDGLECLNP